MKMKKGISPLIAGVLLIAFTLAVAAIISGWLTSLTKTTTEKTEKGVSTQVECSKAVIEIEKVTSSDVIIHNSGSVSLTGNFTVECNTTVSTTSRIVLEKGSYNKTGVGCSSGKLKVCSLTCPTVCDECTVGIDCPT